MFDITGNSLLAIIISVFVASIPGVVVAFLTQYLAQRREDQMDRRLFISARQLLALEVDNNRKTLEEFWLMINNLDEEQHTEVKPHLEAMAENGLLGYALPHWSFSRWQRLESKTFPAFSSAEITGVDQITRGLEGITDLYMQLITLTPEEQKLINSGGSTQRFWAGYYGGWRDLTFTKLTKAVNQVLDAPHPLNA